MFDYNSYTAKLVSLIAQVVDLEEDSYDCEKLESILDGCVEANRHWYLARLGVVLEQSEKLDEPEDILPSEDLEWCEIGALYAIHSWFVKATRSGKWVLADHYADACQDSSALHMHPEVVQSACIEAMDCEEFHDFSVEACEKFLESLGAEEGSEPCKWSRVSELCHIRLNREVEELLAEDDEEEDDCSEVEKPDGWTEECARQVLNAFSQTSTAALVMASVHPDPLRGQLFFL